jgi:hypothetical protein
MCTQVQMVSPTEAWAACGQALSQIKADAHFFHSTDGGGNWSEVSRSLITATQTPLTGAR